VRSPALAAAASRRERYRLVACKQMATVWVRRELVAHVGHLRFSLRGARHHGLPCQQGLHDCISVSMSLHQTSLCMLRVQPPRLRRNSDVVEILKNTQFCRLCKRSGRRIPERILDHE